MESNNLNVTYSEFKVILESYLYCYICIPIRRDVVIGGKFCLLLRLDLLELPSFLADVHYSTTSCYVFGLLIHYMILEN